MCPTCSALPFRPTPAIIPPSPITTTTAPPLAETSSASNLSRPAHRRRRALVCLRCHCATDPSSSVHRLPPIPGWVHHQLKRSPFLVTDLPFARPPTFSTGIDSLFVSRLSPGKRLVCCNATTSVTASPPCASFAQPKLPPPAGHRPSTTTIDCSSLGQLSSSRKPTIKRLHHVGVAKSESRTHEQS